MIATPITLRTLRADDRPAIARVLESCDAFRAEEVAIGLELVDESLDPGPSTDYAWILAEVAGEVVGFACFGPVPLTEGTFDLYWIAVAPEGRGGRRDPARRRGRGRGPGPRRALVAGRNLVHPALCPGPAFYVAGAIASSGGSPTSTGPATTGSPSASGSTRMR